METTAVTADPRVARSVPCPWARHDALLRYSTTDLISLCEALRDAERRSGSIPPDTTPWVQRVERRLADLDPVFVANAAKIGMKTGDAFTPLEWQEHKDLPCGLEQAASAVLHAVICAVSGTAYADLMAAASAPVADEVAT